MVNYLNKMCTILSVSAKSECKKWFESAEVFYIHNSWDLQIIILNPLEKGEWKEKNLHSCLFLKHRHFLSLKQAYNHPGTYYAPLNNNWMLMLGKLGEGSNLKFIFIVENRFCQNSFSLWKDRTAVFGL